MSLWSEDLSLASTTNSMVPKLSPLSLSQCAKPSFQKRKDYFHHNDVYNCIDKVKCTSSG